MMLPSLRRNLVLILLTLTLLSWLLAALVTVVLAQQLVVQQVDRQLVQYMDMAHHTQGIVLRSDPLKDFFWQRDMLLSQEAGITRVRGFGSEGREQAVNLWFDTQQVLVGELAPAFPAPVETGFVTWPQRADDELIVWRVLYRHDPELGVWIAVGVNLQHAGGLGRAALLRAMLPLLVVLPLTVLILLWGVKRGLRPLQRLAGNIEARNPHALEPIDAADVPLEVRPVVEALNGLLDRLQRALASESRFTANAAHELQTPLAAIKAEVQRYQRQASDSAAQDMLERIAARVTRASNTVGQLLTLARLDPEQQFERRQVRLDSLLLEVIAEEGGRAMDRSLDIQLGELPSVEVSGHREWLQILLRNLVANAFKYSPQGSAVQIDLDAGPAGVQLQIANDCAAIPPAVRQGLLERFTTLPENTASGVGLGLSIAARIAELHGAGLGLGERLEGGGFVVTLHFHPGAAGVLNS